MGRNRSPPPAKPAAAAPKPAATQHAKPTSAPPPAHRPAPAPQAHAPPAQQHHAPPAQQHHAPPAPSMASGLMGTMAASAAGAVAGHAISNMMFGNHAPASQGEVSQLRSQIPQSDPCKTWYDAYFKCNDSAMSSGAEANCGWAWDEVAKCRQQHGTA